MRVVAALGGNALLRRGQPLTAENQRANIAVAARALLPIALEHDLILTHGNGPQVGLLALQNAAYRPDELYPLDILDAETEGMIGYLLEQELGNLLPPTRPIATLLTRIAVDADDPAFGRPTKPIGPVYGQAEAERLASEKGWTIAPDGGSWRRVVPSPEPRRILELPTIELLVREGVLVVCAGGGGIPVVEREDGTIAGIEAVIDKDLAGALLAASLGADAYLMLTDVDAVYAAWGTPTAHPLRRIAAEALDPATFASGSMGPKVAAAKRYAMATGGRAVIGALAEAEAMLAGTAGTVITGRAGRAPAARPSRSLVGAPAG
ncbi:MAG TPA: carbamate kinase [Candidatus Limnocylindrales bacterium]|nr:carbamate kinase [Candidatus Limnocylindrales bacterium]